MKTFKLLIESLKLKLYIYIAKQNIKLIKYFSEQKKELDKIMTNYNVESNLVELKTPNYKYYKVWKNISMEDVLNNEMQEKDIPENIEIKQIINPLEINSEGYYCLSYSKIEYYGKFDGKTYMFTEKDIYPYKEIKEGDDDSYEGYYKKTKTIKKYYHAISRFHHKEFKFDEIPAEEIENIRLIDDISIANENGYYKVIV